MYRQPIGDRIQLRRWEMTAYVEKLGRRDEIAELIERHFEIVWVFLSNDQANGATSCAGPIVGSRIHGILPSEFGLESCAAKLKAPRDRCRKSPRRSRAPPKVAAPQGTAWAGQPHPGWS